MRRWRNILASFALHGAFLALLFLHFHRPLPPSELPLMVDLTPLPEKPIPAAGKRGGRSGAMPAGAGKRAKNLALAALAPHNKDYLIPQAPGSQPLPSQDPFSPFASSQDFAANEDAGSLSAITWAHNKLQLSLGYPEAFIHNDISGQASARFAFGDSGKLLPESVQVHADSPYLRVYVHRLIEKTFQGAEVPLSLRKWRNRLELFCFVRFSLVESATALTTGLPFLGNRLYFTRQSVKSQLEKLKWQVGPLHGIFPLPALGVDMLWFARKAEEMQHPRAPVDELAPYREDPLFYN